MMWLQGSQKTTLVVLIVLTVVNVQLLCDLGLGRARGLGGVFFGHARRWWRCGRTRTRQRRGLFKEGPAHNSQQNTRKKNVP